MSSGVVVGEVGSLEGAVACAPTCRTPGCAARCPCSWTSQARSGRAIGAVGGQPLGPEAEALLACGRSSCAAAPPRPGGSRGRLDVDDDGVVEVDQIVGARRRRRRARHSRRSSARPDRRATMNFGSTWRRAAEGRIVEHGQILPDGMAQGRRRGSHRSPGVERCRLASALIRLASTAKPSPPTSPSAMQRRDRRLEQLAQQIAVAEAPMPVLREGRVVGHRAVQAEPAEPAIGEIEVNLFAQPPLRADAEAVTDDQHPDHQLRIDRRPARLAVERPQLLADVAEVHEPVDRPQQVIAGTCRSRLNS